jgi:arylsulfatase A-like enzyme
VLLILVDQLRHDVFSHRGHPVVRTPNVDRLASEGVLFSEATCSSPACGPARAALLSGCFGFDGKYAFENREPDEPGVWRADLTTLDEALDAAGYHVEYHGKWHLGRAHRKCYRGDRAVFGKSLPEYRRFLLERYPLPPDDGEHATDRFTGWRYEPWDVDAMLASAAGQGPELHFHEAGILRVADEHTITAWTVQKTLRFLEDPPPGPWAVTCSVLQPHSPLIASETYARLYPPEAIPLPANLAPPADPVPLVPGAISADARGLGQFMALYLGLVAELDHWIGRLLAALDERGLARDTLVILTSDHGEMMGSHGTLAKLRFYEECLRVPLILRYPRAIAAGARSSAPAAGADLANTVLDYCGLAPLEGAHGRSLRGLLDGRARSDPYAYAELGRARCLRSREHKLVRVPGRPRELYDLAQDPLETENLLAMPDARAHALAEELEQHLASKYPLANR